MCDEVARVWFLKTGVSSFLVAGETAVAERERVSSGCVRKMTAGDRKQKAGYMLCTTYDR